MASVRVVHYSGNSRDNLARFYVFAYKHGHTVKILTLKTIAVNTHQVKLF